MSRTSKNYSSPLPASRILALAAAVVFFLSLSACTPAAPTKNATLRVGVALYDQDDTFISTVVQHMERAARTAEEERNLKINLSLMDGRGNQTLQNDQVEQFLEEGYDVICINIVDRTVAAVLIDKAQQAKIPLIFFNRQPVGEDIERWEEIYYVGALAQQSGQLQGDIVLEAWQNPDRTLDRNGDGVLQYVMLEGEPGHQDALLRTQYSISRLITCGVAVEKLAGDTANWSRAQAATRVEQWLAEFGGEIEVIFSNNDDMALGAIDACLEAGMEPENLPFIVGVDATPPALEAITAGTLSGTVNNDAKGIAQAMLDLTLALTSGQDPAQVVDLTDGHYVWLPYRPVTAETLEDFLKTQ